jgi:thioredoxin-like negative regulator of GroEL
MKRGGTIIAHPSLMESGSQAVLEKAKRLANEGFYGESAEAFETAFEGQSHTPEALIALADVMAGIGQPESSLALLADSVDSANPSLPTLIKIADQLEEVGRLAESADFLVCSLALSPEHPGLMERTSKAVEALGRVGQLEWIKSGCSGDIPEALA